MFNIAVDSWEKKKFCGLKLALYTSILQNPHKKLVLVNLKISCVLSWYPVFFCL